MIKVKYFGFLKNKNMSTKTNPFVDEKIFPKDKFSLILFNDHHNSFDYVIENLQEYCGHSRIQAEQCATIVHTKGKYAVKSGEFDEMLDLMLILSERDLTVTLSE